jgi:hypothetical protein
VEVRADDGDDMGPPGTAWKVIQNAPPVRGEDLPDPRLDEDTPDSVWIDLTEAFDDPDGDPLTWSVEPTPLHLGVEIDPDTGTVTITPEPDWFGTEDLVFWATDGEYRANQTVTVTVTSVNDPPRFTLVNGRPYTGGTVSLVVDQGEELIILVEGSDIEGDDLQFRVDTPKVELDEATGRMNFTPGNGDVGWLNFSLSLNDNVQPSLKEYIEFTVEIRNINDELDDPRIISPEDGDSFNWNSSVGLRGVCSDPDERHGQVLNYTWRSNRTGLLGYESVLNFRFTDAGAHNITLTVTDGEYSKEVWVHMVVGEEPLPPPPPPPKEEEGNLWLYLTIAIVAVLVVLGALFIVSRRKREKAEEAEEAEEVPPEVTAAEERRAALKGFADAMKETADQFEKEWKAEPAEEEGPIEVAGTGMVPSSAASHKMRLSERTSEETAKLWDDVEKETPTIDEAEKEALRQANLQRMVQSAIQALPYGIPAPALRHIPPHLLAEEVVKGSRHTLPDGRELVAVRGAWYHADHEDSSTFLMPYKGQVDKKEEKEEAYDASEWEEAE